MARRFIEHTEGPLFDLPDPLIVKGQDNAEAGTHHAQAEEKQPAFDMQAGMKPLKKMHDMTPPVIRLPFRNPARLLLRHFC